MWEYDVKYLKVLINLKLNYNMLKRNAKPQVTYWWLIEYYIKHLFKKFNMENQHTTNYVVPKSSEELRFKERTFPARHTDDDLDQSIWRNNADAEIIGVLDWAKESEKYLQLLSSLGIGGVSNSELREILKINLIIPDNDATGYHNNSHQDQALQTHAVFLHMYWQLSR